MVYILRNRGLGGKDIVRNGLILLLDASHSSSYPGSGTRWFDISGSNAHADAFSMPSFVRDGARSYFDFNGTGNGFNSVSLNQTYRDLFVVQRLSTVQTSLPMPFSRHPNADASLRYENVNGNLVARTGPDQNDWQMNQTGKVFVNGQFNRTGFPLQNIDAIVRAFRTQDSGNFAASFRYQLSSQFMGRHFGGRMYMVFCYNRELSNAEVLQNYEALRGRFSI